MRIRPVDISSSSGDFPAIQAIYAHHVKNSLGTFETEPPDLNDVRARLTGIVQAGLPSLVAEREGRVVGYAYANQFRPRTALIT